MKVNLKKSSRRRKNTEIPRVGWKAADKKTTNFRFHRKNILLQNLDLTLKFSPIGSVYKFPVFQRILILECLLIKVSSRIYN